MSWFNTIEFYVITGALAAGAIALAALPPRRSAARQYLLAGSLSGTDDPGLQPEQLDLSVDNQGRLHILRRGLPNITDGGAASIAVAVNGFDITIEERLTYGRGWPTVDSAEFVLDFLAPERYHIRYNSDPTGLFTAFALTIRPGIRASKPLRR